MNLYTQHAIEIFNAGVRSVLPDELLPVFIKNESGVLQLDKDKFNLSQGEDIYILSLGKAAASMAATVEKILDGIPFSGIALTKYHHGRPLKKIICLEAGHPVPDINGVKAAERIISFIQKISEKDILILLVSGGASALLADLADGISLDDLQTLNHLLLRCGASIGEINAIRKHFSTLKGGRLAARAWPARIYNFLLSDVPGNETETIGSGPAVADPRTFRDAWMVLEKYELTKAIPKNIFSHLQNGLNGLIEETPKPGAEKLNNTVTRIIGSNQTALAAACTTALEHGYLIHAETAELSGEAKLRGAEFAGMLCTYNGPRPACFLMGGETTVTVTGTGKGGRNQEFVLAAICALQKMGVEEINCPVILSGGTDGSDGPTEAAGAWCDAQLFGRMKNLKIDPEIYLAQNDSYHFFERCDGLLITGPTFTNVMDVVVGIVE
jgi:glycerate 2-kinase